MTELTSEQIRMMSFNLEKNYKALCDKIKVMLLDSLISSGEELKIKGYSLHSLRIIKIGVEEQIEEQKQKEIATIADVISNMIGRFGTEYPNKGVVKK
jgi:hypothetical protein